MPPWHSVYAFFGADTLFAPAWEKPLAACPGTYLDANELAAIVAAAAMVAPLGAVAAEALLAAPTVASTAPPAAQAAAPAAVPVAAAC